MSARVVYIVQVQVEYESIIMIGLACIRSVPVECVDSDTGRIHRRHDTRPQYREIKRKAPYAHLGKCLCRLRDTPSDQSKYCPSVRKPSENDGDALALSSPPAHASV